MSNLINEAVMRANVSMHDNLRGSSRFSEGSGERRGESVTQGGNVKEHGGEGKQDGESIDEYEEEDGDVEGAEGTISSTHSPFLLCLCLKTTSVYSSLFEYLLQNLALFMRGGSYMSHVIHAAPHFVV